MIMNEIVAALSFFLKKKKQKFKARRSPRSSHTFRENLSKKTKVFAKIFSGKCVHLLIASRPAMAFARLRNNKFFKN